MRKIYWRNLQLLDEANHMKIFEKMIELCQYRIKIHLLCICNLELINILVCKKTAVKSSSMSQYLRYED